MFKPARNLGSRYWGRSRRAASAGPVDFVGGISGPVVAAMSITFRSVRNGPDIGAVGLRKRWRAKMDKEHIKGTADKAKGAIKDTAGKMTGDKQLQSEGKMDKAKGSVHNAAGDLKDVVKNATE